MTSTPGWILYAMNMIFPGNDVTEPHPTGSAKECDSDTALHAHTDAMRRRVMELEDNLHHERRQRERVETVVRFLVALT